MAPVISVITPSFNQGNYIEETIASVLSQDYPHIEYMVVDGGSTDNTLNILRQYRGKIRWISEKDNGQADAINKGVRMTKGEIVAWLNSDDIFLPGAIQKVAEYFDNHPDVQMIYGKAYFIDPAGKIVGRYPTEPFNFERLASFNFVCQPSAFFRRETFYDVGGLNPELHYSLDYDLWIRIAQKFSVRYFPVFLSGYRLHETSKTVGYDHALPNHKEGLNITLKYYKWAPANRVYGYYYHLTELKLPRFLRKMRPVTVILGLLVSIVKYIQLNKGIRRKDIKALTPKNLKKLFIPWGDLYKTYRD